MNRWMNGLGVVALAGALWGGEAAQAAFRGFTLDGNDTVRPEANGRENPVPSIQAAQVNGDPIKVDGKLDESVWVTAPAGTGFKIWSPNRGELPSEETIFKVAYDDDAVYFAVACLEKDPAKIDSKLARRDRFPNSDLVSVYIDPYLDKTTGYNFKVNPAGVQQDSYMFLDGQRDDDWDAVWQAETSRDEDGWYAEIRIPFSAVRYRKADEMTWGLQVYRYMHGRGEDTAWVTWDQQQSGFISRFGELRGIRNVPSPRQLEILPYVVQRATDPSIQGPGDELDNSTNVGGDLKYGVTADLTLNATIQPDFGQVEADPAELNLSPFETQFTEKRPFFIEGSKFFQHPDFNLFYSRRIGTGDRDARIRYAGKLTGKVAGDVSVAALVASTDLTGRGQSHNLFKSGDRLSRFAVARVGKEFDGGKHGIRLMGTAVQNTGDRATFGDRFSREAYTGGLDYDITFQDRKYRIHGSLVGSIVDPEELEGSPGSGARRYGTGGNLQLRKQGGKLRSILAARWEHDQLSLNDVGFLSAPDEYAMSYWLGYPYHPNGKSKTFNVAELNFNMYKSWLYAGRAGYDVTTGEEVWRYDSGHRQFMNTNINAWAQFTNYRELWAGIELIPEGSQRYETRGGPLITEPTTFGGWFGGSTDSRKNLVFDFDTNHFRDTAHNHSTNASVGMRWNQSSAMNHQARLAFRNRLDDTQYLETVDLRDRPGGMGIGGLSYVFGDITQRTIDLTLRSSILFSRDKSLDLYVQPFVTVGDYGRIRELARADSYDLVDYAEPGVAASDFDFEYGSVNLNAVYRWEYRPGSTIFLVWTHGRETYDERRFHGSDAGRFDNALGTGSLFDNEPQNAFLIKISYWLAP
jgi:hypothetical protein